MEEYGKGGLGRVGAISEDGTGEMICGRTEDRGRDQWERQLDWEWVYVGQARNLRKWK